MAARQAGGPPSQRRLRVGEEIRHALAAILARGELRDPDLAGVSITVAEVRVSPDLRHASAFVAPLGGGDSATLVKALTRASGYLRTELAKRVRLRAAPTLSFLPDASFDYASRIDRVLNQPDVRRDMRRDGESGGPAEDGGK